MTDSQFATVVSLLERIASALEGRRPKSEVHDIEMVQSMFRAFGERRFTAVELSKHARLPRAGELRAALERGVGDLDPRRIGRAMQRVEGKNFQGVMVERVGTLRDGIVWAMQVCELNSRDSRAVADARARVRAY